MKSLILIDTSFTLFYRFFATIRWYSIAYPEEYKEIKDNPNYEWLTNKIFIEKYDKLYLESIIKSVSQNVFDNSEVIFCMDAPRSQLWRCDLDSKYKKDRADLSLKNNFKPIFKHTINVIISKIIDESENIKLLRIKKVEADDIIAVICKNVTKPIYIISGDKDFHQLGNKNITFINFKDKLVLTEKEAKESLRNKILLGDPSDCIPSIFPKGFKKKKILESEEKLHDFLETNLEAKKQYEHNKKMIDFDYIPKKYYNKIIEYFNLVS
jgi:5'-3' exonuclease